MPSRKNPSVERLLDPRSFPRQLLFVSRAVGEVADIRVQFEGRARVTAMDMDAQGYNSVKPEDRRFVEVAKEELESIHFIAALLSVLNAAPKQGKARTRLEPGGPSREERSEPVHDGGERNGTPEALEHGLEACVPAREAGQERLGDRRMSKFRTRRKREKRTSSCTAVNSFS